MTVMNIKSKRIMILSVLLIVSFMLIGLIYISLNKDIGNDDIVVKEDNKQTLDIEEIKVSDVAESTVEVEEIKPDTSLEVVDDKMEEVIINEPMPIEPEKPENTAPTVKPKTTDDLENMAKEPKYKEEEVIYTEKKDIEPKAKPEPIIKDKSSKSNLVPDSENPFLQDNIPTNGEGGFQNSSEYSDHVPGTGDKF